MKPLFKRESPSPASAPQAGVTSTSSSNRGTVSSPTKDISSPHSADGVSLNQSSSTSTSSQSIPQGLHSVTVNGSQSLHPISSSNTSSQPQKVVKSTSIFSGLGQSGSQNNPSSAPTQSETQNISSSKTLELKDQTTLEVVWRKVSENLQSTEKVLATRMASIIPTLQREGVIEIECANQNVETFFKSYIPTIKSGFKQELGEGELEFVLKKGEVNGPQKILSSYEQLEEMFKLNPSIRKLKENLGLSLQ